MIDDSELRILGAQLGTLAAKTATSVSKEIVVGAKVLETVWRANATESSGTHGKLYPKAITTTVSFRAGGLEAEIGPDPDLPQGGMSFEFGSAKQQPHLDGQRAADVEIPKLEARIAHVAGGFLG